MFKNEFLKRYFFLRNIQTMNAFLNPRKGASLANIIDVTAHSISLFQANAQPKDIK